MYLESEKYIQFRGEKLLRIARRKTGRNAKMEKIMRRVSRVNGVIAGAALAILLGSTAQLMAEDLNPDKEIPAAATTESLLLAPLTYHADLVNTGFGVGSGIPGSTTYST